MKVKDLIKDIDFEVITGDINKEISDISTDTRNISNNSIFICISGTKYDSHSDIVNIVKDGAVCVVIEKDIDIKNAIEIDKDITIIKVKNSRNALGYMSKEYYGSPTDKLKIIGITGTKGKTTTAYMIRSAIENAGKKVGLIGTIEIIVGKEHIPSLNTTPDALTLQKYFKKMVDSNIEYVVMEVSSQAYLMDRVTGIIFDIGVFTNLSPDHIGGNEHSTFENYLYCKSMLFKNSKMGIANIDDKYFSDITKNAECNIITYGIEKKADYKACNINLTKGHDIGIEYDISGSLKRHVKLNSIGLFSIYNSLCAIAVCDKLEIDIDMAIEGISNTSVKGRLEKISISPDFTLMIDYAHNGVSLSKLLKSIREYEPKRLVCLFGCGGDRDPKRRYEMGKVAGELADFTIITSDNPRTEDMDKIIDDIEGAIKDTKAKYIRIRDRKEAMKYAIDNAKKGDIIIFAGKGHETYQEINGVKYPFDERIIIDEICKSRS